MKFGGQLRHSVEDSEPYCSDKNVAHKFSFWQCMTYGDILRYYSKMLSYRRETALYGALVLAKSERLELRDNILRTL